ncbi:MAG TPA: hypothetical protein VMW17_23070 [Candidatus Binatia bacterium]|nr:hypothetical protein [Candidatus Binatia bacterium]
MSAAASPTPTPTPTPTAVVPTETPADICIGPRCFVASPTPAP